MLDFLIKALAVFVFLFLLFLIFLGSLQDWVVRLIYSTRSNFDEQTEFNEFNK